MTQVGKILVLVIMAFSLIFLGISTMVFMTSKNWRDATQKQQEQVKKVQGQLTTEQANHAKAKKDLEEAQVAATTATKKLESQIKTLEDQNQRDLAQITEVRKNLEVANQSAKSALEEVDARRKETLLLREQKSAVEKQANEYQLRQADLNDKIRELERMLDTATKNNTDLRERVAKYTAALSNAGLSTDIATMKGLEAPPQVSGEITRTDPRSNKMFEVSIGSDDGLVPGHQLLLYRTKPRPEYLGRVEVVRAEPDQAVVRVIGNTVQGKKIKEGDIVSSNIIAR